MIAPQPCIRWTSKDPDHDATCASAAKLRGGGPNLKSGIEARNHAGSPPPRIVFRQSVCSAEISCYLMTQVAMRRSWRSEGMVPVVTMRQSTISNLRASATIIVFRVELRPSAARLLYHCARPEFV
jgi:hypothetical protein